MVRYTEEQLEELKAIIYKNMCEEKGRICQPGNLFMEDELSSDDWHRFLGTSDPNKGILGSNEVVSMYLEDLFKRLRGNEEKKEPEDLNLALPFSGLGVALEGDFEDLPMIINTASPLSEGIMKWRMEKGI